MSVLLDNIQAFLFDMDGVVVDSSEIIHQIYTRWAIRHGFDIDVISGNLQGGRTIDFLSKMDLAPESVVAHSQELRNEEVRTAHLVRALPGAHDLLAMLPPNRWAIVTSSVRDVAEARITQAGLPVPRVLVSADDVDTGKPSPKPYELAAFQLGARTEHCVVFEDSINGVLSANAALMRCVGVGEALTSAQPKQVCGTVFALGEVRVTQQHNGYRIFLDPDVR
ncbi:HAD family hydrolase [Nocardiopsis rhodophaea]|uniref:HAD family hydrolase n=1 Tax=Nocardiopsis rhodophaea TaxID=280238 RepID=A0ABN2S1N0_9ACTN